MKKYFLFGSFFLLISFSAFAKTWMVGPSRAYTAPSKVAALVQDGDTVAIDSGTYTKDVCQWNANKLLIKGVGGYARLLSGGTVYGGKAIWVINGNNTTVEHIEFAQATCVDQNGAGIRRQGLNLTVRYCYFHDNDDGILAGALANSDILIEYCEFNHNGFGDGYSHNLYINQVHSLTFRYNYSHRAKIGHELKSRALHNYILYNRFSNENDGTASRDIDLPNGGFAIILGNIIEQGPQTQNSNMMEYGLEGLSNPDSQLYIVNNTIVNDYGKGTFLQIQNGTALCKMYNNAFAGPGTIITGTAAKLDSVANWIGTVSAAGFVNSAAYDYHLKAGSPLVNNAVNAGKADTFSLTPKYEYMHPTGMVARKSNAGLDIGAYEYGSSSSITYPIENKSLEVYPNPSSGLFVIRTLGPFHQGTQVQLFDIEGKMVFNKQLQELDSSLSVDLSTAKNGLYILKINSLGTVYTVKVIINK